MRLLTSTESFIDCFLETSSLCCRFPNTEDEKQKGVRVFCLITSGMELKSQARLRLYWYKVSRTLQVSTLKFIYRLLTRYRFGLSLKVHDPQAHKLLSSRYPKLCHELELGL